MQTHATKMEEEIIGKEITEEMVERALREEVALRRQLKRDGFVHLRDWRGGAGEFASGFGEVIQVTDVVVDRDSKSLVTSHRELDVHTDHSRARYILWECRQESESGGTSVLVDTRPIVEALSEADREALRQVYLTEHRVFREDPSRVPLLRKIDGQERVYFSFWLLEEEVPAGSREALERFRGALEAAPRERIQLASGDLLIIDNHRMLHGRTEIETDSKRHLVRYWIAEEAPVSPRVRPGKERRGPKCPRRISDAEIEALIEAGVDREVAAMDLSMVKMKIQDGEEGYGWTPAQCEEVELEYKRFLTLNLRYPDHAVVPTKEMDQLWHYHILDTRAYHADCERVFGEYFHHFPYFGMRSEEDEGALKSAFEETCEIYHREFGEELLRNVEASDCWHDCQGRCWHACKSD